MIVEKKEVFLRQLREFASQLEDKVAAGGEWNVRGFIDRYRQVYGISDDTKVISKVLELQLFPYFQIFAEEHGYILELSDKQNYYPDMTFIDARDETIKFAVDLKSTYRDEKHPDFCKGFTLGSFGKYFIDRTSRKNIMYPYGEYAAHIIFGIIYSRSAFSAQEATRPYRVEDVERIPAVARKRNGNWQAIRRGAAIPRTSAVSSISLISCKGMVYSLVVGRISSMITG